MGRAWMNADTPDVCNASPGETIRVVDTGRHDWIESSDERRRGEPCNFGKSYGR